MERKVCFILDAGNPAGGGGGGGGRRLSKGQFPSTDNQWARAFIGGGRGSHAETAQSALAVILKLVIGGLTGVMLIVLSTFSLQFQGRSFSHFFEARSQNCGSLCRGYSLAIM